VLGININKMPTNLYKFG